MCSKDGYEWPAERWRVPIAAGLSSITAWLRLVTGYLHDRAGGWPGMMRDEKAGDRTPVKIATTAYYDTVNFARRLKQPGIYTWGYNDETCPPTSMFAAYNVIAAPKELLLALETGHSTSAEQAERINAWVLAQTR